MWGYFCHTDKHQDAHAQSQVIIPHTEDCKGNGVAKKGHLKIQFVQHI